jgi:preprotein translocase subunit SecY
LAQDSTFGSMGKMSDLKKRLLFVLGAMIIFRLGAHIPVPGIDPIKLKEVFDTQGAGLLGMFNMFSGGALSRFSVFALGIMPYISSSIIMTLLGSMTPHFKELKKDGAAGARILTKYTRQGTVVLAAFQAIGITMALEGQSGLVLDPGLTFRLVSMITLVSGTMFLVWLGEQISERGVGYGISMIIFAGIVSGLPGALGNTLQLAKTGAFSIPFVIFLFVAAILVTAFVVFVERGQRRITINYARRQVGNKLYGGQSSFLPLKINQAGVIPAIFASSVILFPATIAGWFGQGTSLIWLKDISAAISPGQPIYIFMFASAIIFFAYFYTAITSDPKETADNLKKSGGFVPGIRPGEQTAKYIDTISGRLTFIGAMYITLVCLLPELLILKFNTPFYFGGTSLLIIVVVIMDFINQIQSRMMSYQYDGMLKKTKLKGSSGGIR